MTWKDLAEVIAKQMTPEDLNQEVRFMEPYDDGNGYTLSIVRADANIYADEEDAGVEDEDRIVFIPKGEFYLA